MEEIKYKFFATGRSGTIEVFPQNGSTLLVSWEKEKEQAYFRRFLKGKLLFVQPDFDWFYSLETSVYRCDPIQLSIHKKCGETYIEDFVVCTLLLNKGNFDIDQCSVEIEPTTEDKFTCYDDHREEEFNLFSYVLSNETVSLLEGEIETLVCTTLDSNSSVFCGSGSVNDGWAVQNYEATKTTEPNVYPARFNFNITYAREVKTSLTPLLYPWVSIGGDQYAKQPALFNYRKNESNLFYGTYTDFGGSIDNGMKLKDAFQALLYNSCTGLTVRSNFFGWNQTVPINKNLLDYSKVTANVNLTTLGQTETAGDVLQQVTDFIKVTPGGELWLVNPGTLGGGNNSFFDINKNFVSLAPPVPGASSPVKIADIPGNVHYVRYEEYGLTHESMLYMGTGGIAFAEYEQPVNYVTLEPSKVENLILFQKSDVKRPNTSNDANAAVISFKKLLEDICNLFQLKYDITENGEFILEHVSYFQKSAGLNLVGRYDSNLRVAKNKYTYDFDNMPRRELYSMMDEKFQSGDFRGLPIEYKNSCVGNGAEKDKKIVVENIMTDVTLAMQNPDPESAVVTDEGFVLVACDSNNNIISEGSILGGNFLNNTLSWARLHKDYWLHDKITTVLNMNGFDTEAKSVVPTKKQVKLEALLCCGDTFDPEQTVATFLGNGYVRTANFDLYRETLSLELLYVADENLAYNAPPVAVNESVETYEELAIDIDAAFNDTDSDGTINLNTLEIVNGGLHGTSSIVDNKIRYVPNAGFTGEDHILYRIKDNLMEPSNIGIITVTVNLGTALPVANPDSFKIASNKTLVIGNILSNDTGVGSLVAIAETKSTSEGGTVQIFANGSFSYTPLTDFIGTDTFDYTLEDDNSNQDTGIASILVFTPQTVYVKYDEINEVVTPIIQGCGIGGTPTQTGSSTSRDRRIRFYSNMAGSVPLDVTGYNLLIDLHEVRDIDGFVSNFDYDIEVTGFSRIDNFVMESINNGCSGTDNVTFSKVFSLNSSPDYIII